MDPASPRSGIGARIGVTALNLWGPGLGLFRIGDWRSGIGVFAAQLALVAIVTVAMAFSPITDHDSAIAFFVAILTAVVGAYVYAMIKTWRGAAFRALRRPWSRWYGLVVIAAAMTGLVVVAVEIAHSFYKPFYLPGESMRPTIDRNDRIVADMRESADYRRGQIVLFRKGDSDWIKRIVALPGDRFAMVNGVPVINGVFASHTRVRTMTLEFDGGSRSGMVLRERLPGGQGDHEVVDTAVTPQDNFAEGVVPPGHVFVLGDNRDHSADSRVSPKQLGSGPVAIGSIIGRPIFISWGADQSRTGRRLDR